MNYCSKWVDVLRAEYIGPSNISQYSIPHCLSKVTLFQHNKSQGWDTECSEENVVLPYLKVVLPDYFLSEGLIELGFLIYDFLKLRNN